MKNLLISQLIGASIVHITNSIKFTEQYEYSISILSSGFLDLINLKYIEQGEKGKLNIINPTLPSEPHLAILYSEIKKSKPKSLRKWMENYLYSLSDKVFINYKSALVKSLTDLNIVSANGEKGIIIKKTQYVTNKELLIQIKDLIEKSLYNDTLTFYELSTIVCLSSATLISHITNKQDEKMIIKIIKKDPQYKVLKGVVDDIYALIIILSTTISI